MASRVQRGHHARGEHVIHELQEALLRDMGVGEEERDWLIGERAIERLEVLTEELLVVSAGKRDRKYVRARRVCGETCNGLLARAADADEEGVPTR